MKKILNFSPAKVLLFCGLGLVMTLGAFWHHQVNQAQLNSMNDLNQGAGTCFNRISQTFTAMMIKDIQSPYLNRGFMSLSDECLGETNKGINPFKKSVGKGYETLNKLIGEVHWFHEKVLQLHSPMMVGKGLDANMSSLSDRFSKMENLKNSLIDEIDAANARLREVQSNNQVLMGMGLLLFVVGLSILSLQEFNRIQLRREIEAQALNLLKAGQANVGAMVDQIVDRALITQGMPVTNQIFKDYHGELLERLASKTLAHAPVKSSKGAPKAMEEVEEEVVADGPRSSLKEILVSLQKVHTKEVLNISEIRDVQLASDFESCEQMLNAALNKIAENNVENKKILVSNQIHTDRSIITFFLGGKTFDVNELEYASSDRPMQTNDMNMMILKEMVNESGASLHVENKVDRQGKISGISIRLTVKRAQKENSKNLVSVMKGKKKDLARELMN